MSNWISVEDRLPNDGQYVLVFADSAFVVCAEYRDKTFYDVLKDENGVYFETVTRDVTCWQPLPPPP